MLKEMGQIMGALFWEGVEMLFLLLLVPVFLEDMPILFLELPIVSQEVFMHMLCTSIVLCGILQEFLLLPNHEHLSSTHIVA